MAQKTGIQSLNAGAPELRLTGDQRPQEDNIRMRIKQIAEQSGHPESFPATDSDFAALAQLSDSPDDFPSTDYDFEVILRIAKEPGYSTPEKSKNPPNPARSSGPIFCQTASAFLTSLP